MPYSKSYGGSMELEILDAAIKVAACVCGKDGVISEAEEQKMFNVISGVFPNYTLQRFNKAIDDFFDESLQLEDYLESVSKEDLNAFTIGLCKSSASADGLDINENIALQKVALILGVQI
jgi:tellurite resistance protein